MPVTDRREPAVYVSIEDASYAAPTLETGRIGYIVTLCDRGPHNRIVKITSREQFYRLFGQPNYRRTSQAHYLADKFLQYSSNLLLVRVMPDDAYWANGQIENSTVGTIITYGEVPTDALFTFTPASASVVCTNASSYAAVSVGQWIYAEGDTIADAGQIIAKTLSTLTLTLDRTYTGTIADEGISALLCTPCLVTSTTSVVSEAQMPTTDAAVIWYFYAKGAGTYYNKIKIVGSRNAEYEKMYTDVNGVVLYKYLFMNIAVYYSNDDGSHTLLEGPWTVSLTRQTALGSTIRDLSSGISLYIEDIINNNSNYIGCISSEAVNSLAAVGSITEAQATKRRLQVMLLLSDTEAVVDSSTGSISSGGILFENGTDGTVDTLRSLPMYNSSNNLESSRDYLDGQILLAYQGALTSVDGSIEQMPECVYPWYQPDYIITGGYSAAVQAGGKSLAEYRQDCIHLADTGSYMTSYSADLTARLNDVPWNSWTSALYVQYRRIFDPFTGEKIWMNPVYHAIERHLYCDGAYFLAEPVAGIEKGQIAEPIELAYKSNHTTRGDLMDVELNCVIVEPQGKYILTQFTTWKRLSVLKRLHVAKFVAYIRKVIPTLLKDILQRRATQYWIGQAQFRVSNFLSKFLESSVERYSVLKNYSVSVNFDDVNSELNVIIDITPIRAIERINVFIIVH
jgi:hypothetical protein